MKPLSSILNQDVIVEMARINTKEQEGSIFPYNEYEVKIWSNDHTPAHFHIIKDGWDLEFLIKTGVLYKIKTKGKTSKTYKYIIDNVNKWLQSKNSSFPAATNQQYADSIWDSLHS